MHDDENVAGGLVKGFVLDGQGGARALLREGLERLVFAASGEPLVALGS
jgi:hypothetical protein